MPHPTAPSLGASTYVKPDANVQSVQADSCTYCIGYLKTHLLLSHAAYTVRLVDDRSSLPSSPVLSFDYPSSLKKQRGNVARSALVWCRRSDDRGAGPNGVGREIGTERTWCRDGIFGSLPSNPYDY